VFRNLDVPLVSNVDAAEVRTVEEVREGLVRQVVSPVRWTDSVEKMIAMGVTRFVEIGPGTVLTGLVKRINPSVELVNINDADSLAKWIG
jgi:[acyl-carrier-protein] S-malonyltransferase